MFENNQNKSNRGGAREGAGRKPGSANLRTREIADKAIQDGVTPLEIMLEAMRSAYEAGEIEKAVLYAKDAAPYMHAKLAAVSHDVDMQIAERHTKLERTIVYPERRED